MSQLIPLVLVGHGNLPQEFLNILNHVMGQQEKVYALSINPQDDMSLRHKELKSLIESLENPYGIIILTDMFGGTPSNMALSLQDHPQVEIIAGINMPLLIKLASLRKTKPLNEIVIEAQTAGRKYIQVASELLKQAV